LIFILSLNNPIDIFTINRKTTIGAGCQLLSDKKICSFIVIWATVIGCRPKPGIGFIPKRLMSTTLLLECCGNSLIVKQTPKY